MRISDHTLNRLAILKAILRHGPVARSDLPGLTGLSAGLITQQTLDLINGGLVTERRDPDSRKGRPRMLLELSSNGPVVIGASIDWSSNVFATFANLAGKELHVVRAPYDPPETLAELATRIGGALRQAIADSPFDEGQIARLGLSLPAVVDSDRGEVRFNTTFAAEPTPFAAPISEILGLPVTIENELDSFARAEHWFGQMREHEDFELLRIGHSIDSAQVSVGVPRHGNNGLNASFGHVKTGLGQGARPCFCGGKGCVTTYASSFGILNAEGLLADLPFPPIPGLTERFDAFVARGQAGEQKALEIIELAGEHLGTALGNYCNVVCPGMLCLTFDNTGYRDLVRPSLERALAAAVMPGTLAATRIAYLEPAEEWHQAGAAALALERIYLEDPRNIARRNAIGKQARLAAVANC